MTATIIKQTGNCETSKLYMQEAEPMYSEMPT
jgi:hypothetical protein